MGWCDWLPAPVGVGEEAVAQPDFQGLCITETGEAREAFCAKEKDKAGILTAGLIMSLSLAFVTSYIIYHNAAFIAKRLLLNENAGSLVLVISVSIPFACLHQCICGYRARTCRCS